MPFYLIRQDITTVHADAIVNAANESLLGGGGVDGAIHAAAGPALLEECRGLGGCRPGEAKRTGAYRLPARYIIHTVGPRWRGGGHGEEALLRSCYRESLLLAARSGCESIAFPLISSGIFGYPREEAMAVAEDEILRFLETEEMTVYLTLFKRDTTRGRPRFPELDELLRREEAGPKPGHMPSTPLSHSRARKAFPTVGNAPKPDAAPMASIPSQEAALPGDLVSRLDTLDESFSQMLLRKITEKGMTDAQCYKKANIDRKLFSKIRSDPHYKPSKPTALAFAVALELSQAETRELLMKAGFALSRSSRFDVIVDYFISRGEYDVFRINEALFTYDQNLLGNL